jgi:sugar lactone lactonase YvrE
VQPDGGLKEKPNFFEPVLMGDFPKNRPKMANTPGTNGMTVDSAGRYYVTSFVGIQVFDSDGKRLGLIDRGETPMSFFSGVTFGGAESNYLYVTGVGALYRVPIEFVTTTPQVEAP